MKLITVACLVAVSLAAPNPQGDVTILRDERVDQGYGYFNYAFELSDGTAVEAFGAPGAYGPVNIRGSYRYILPNGDEHKVTYVADENGFRTGQDLPQDPSGVHTAVLSVVFYGEDADAQETALR